VEGTNARTGADIGTLTPDRLALDIGTRLPALNASIGTRLQFASDFERTEADDFGNLVLAEERDGYTVMDLYADWTPEFAPDLRLTLGVDNVFDEDYERVFEGVSQPGRNWKISASYQFGG